MQSSLPVSEEPTALTPTASKHEDPLTGCEQPKASRQKKLKYVSTPSEHEDPLPEYEQPDAPGQKESKYVPGASISIESLSELSIFKFLTKNDDMDNIENPDKTQYGVSLKINFFTLFSPIT